MLSDHLPPDRRKPTIIRPRGQTERDIVTLGNARPLDHALQYAATEMARWLVQDWRLSIFAASHLMGRAVRYDSGNDYDPAYIVACRLSRALLATVSAPSDHKLA